MAHLTSIDMNDALIAFNSRWSLDGDYLRCAECKRPQIASKADQAFVHQADCTKPHADHTHHGMTCATFCAGFLSGPARAKEA